MLKIKNDNVTFCDIDLFRKIPTINNLGKDYFGTKRLKAPEENELNAIIDEKTNIFTLGAIIFDNISNITNIEERYTKGLFISNKLEEFELNKECYDVLLKATNYNRNSRYNTIKNFENDFKKSIKYINFPKQEYIECEKRLQKNGVLYTTRISNEQGKYILNNKYISPFGVVKIISLEHYNTLEQHPFYNELNDLQKKDISNNIDKKGIDFIGMVLINRGDKN